MASTETTVDELPAREVFRTSAGATLGIVAPILALEAAGVWRFWGETGFQFWSVVVFAAVATAFAILLLVVPRSAELSAAGIRLRGFRSRLTPWSEVSNLRLIRGSAKVYAPSTVRFEGAGKDRVFPANLGVDANLLHERVRAWLAQHNPGAASETPVVIDVVPDKRGFDFYMAVILVIVAIVTFSARGQGGETEGLLLGVSVLVGLAAAAVFAGHLASESRRLRGDTKADPP